MADTAPVRASDDVARILDDCYTEIETIVAGLDEDQWSVRSLCPDWDVRGVLGHLLAVEHMLVGWRPQSAEEALPFDRIGPYLAQTEVWSNDRWLSETTDLFRTRRDELTGLAPDQWAVACPTPVGPGTYSRFMHVRIFDFWVHARDIATPLGLVTDDGGPAAEVALDEIERSIGYIVGKKIGLPDGMAITFRLSGPVQRDIHAVVDGRARRVDTLANPTVLVTTDSATFTQLACGRIDPQDPIDDGRIVWSGDGEWGERAARNLAFTM